MIKLSQIIKNIKLKKVLTVLLVSSLVVISTACSQSDLAQKAEKGIADTAQKVMTDSYDDYDAKQQFKGGMNGYNDDRRYDAETAVKAKALVDTARSRQKDNLGDYADSITDRAGDKIEQAKREIPRNIQENREEAVNYIENKSDSLKRSFNQVSGQAKDVYDEAVDTAQNTIDDATNATKSTAKEIKGNFKDLT